jgi:hypothetical protein
MGTKAGRKMLVKLTIGRRVAEQSLQILMIKLLQNFDLTWAADYPDIDAISYLINQPDKPVKIKLNPIN